MASEDRRRLLRSRDSRMLAGVCGGIAEYLGIDPTVMRLAWAAMTVLTGIGPGVILYFVAWIIMPEAEAA